MPSRAGRPDDSDSQVFLGRGPFVALFLARRSAKSAVGNCTARQIPQRSLIQGQLLLKEGGERGAPLAPTTPLKLQGSWVLLAKVVQSKSTQNMAGLPPITARYYTVGQLGSW